MHGAYPKGTQVDLGGGLVVKTDGLNTLAKVAQYTGALFVIFGDQDELMPTSFADTFVDARYRKGGREAAPVCAMLRGGHCENMYFFEDATANQDYAQHLDVRFLQAERAAARDAQILASALEPKGKGKGALEATALNVGEQF